MTVRELRRSVIDRWVKVVRSPFVAAVQLLPGDRGSRETALLLIDRADANVRATVGWLTTDDELRADAFRRRTAADARERASELRAKAKEEQHVADAQLARELDAGARLRAQAEGDARQRLRDADQEQARKQSEAEASAAAQERAVDQQRQERLAAADTEAKRERLEVLDEQADALDQEEAALTARDEAQRLRNAVREPKAERKSRSSARPPTAQGNDQRSV